MGSVLNITYREKSKRKDEAEERNTTSEKTGSWRDMPVDYRTTDGTPKSTSGPVFMSRS